MVEMDVKLFNCKTCLKGRINPSLGYIKGNVQILSNRANRLKNNATASELSLIADFMDSNDENI